MPLPDNIFKDDGVKVWVEPGVLHPTLGFYQVYGAEGCHSYPNTPEAAKLIIEKKYKQWIKKGTNA